MAPTVVPRSLCEYIGKTLNKAQITAKNDVTANSFAFGLRPEQAGQSTPDLVRVKSQSPYQPARSRYVRQIRPVHCL